jgi:diguanylate cyclase (GGDEF)-like protein
MIFDSLTQAVASIGMLQKYYPVTRIWDASHKQMLYESEETDNPKEAPISFEGFHEATFSIRENDGLLEIVTSIPITIGGQTCCLELIHLGDMRTGSTSLEHMQKLAITDPLTNLYNRRYIDEQLPIDLERTFRNSDPISFIYADIDFFKKVNDQYGHIAGDHILKEIACVFLRHIRRKDGWVARYGGDELLVCLPELSRNTVVKIANRLRHSVESKRFYINDIHIKITCSFGVQTIDKTSGVHTVDQVVELMDKKLYQAKKKGRNKVAL